MNKLKDLFNTWHDRYVVYEKRLREQLASFKEQDLPRKYATYKEVLEYLEQCARDAQDALKENRPDASSRVKQFIRACKDARYMLKPWWRAWGEALLFALGVVIIVRTFFIGLYHIPTGSGDTALLVGDRVLGSKISYAVRAPRRDDLVIFTDPQFRYHDLAIVRYWQKFVGFSVPLLGLPAGASTMVKRVIAVPGDTIEGRAENGITTVYRNGEKLDEPYVNKYPVIGLEKSVGFIDLNRIGPLPIPKFLKRRRKQVFYTFVPEKDFPDQPYYRMSSREVLLMPGTLHPWLKYPKTPTRVDTFGPITIPPDSYWVMGDSRRNSIDSRHWGLLDAKLIKGYVSAVIYSIDSEEPFWFFDFFKHPINFWKKRVRWWRFFSPVSSTNHVTQGRTS